MKLASRQGALVASVVLAQAAALVAVRQAEAWSYRVNGYGWGTVTVKVWCWPNAPPAAPSYSAGGGPGFGATASLGPGLPGCNPLTRVRRTNGALWQNSGPWVAGGGDTVGGHDLYPLVTPTSLVADGDLDVAASILSSTSAMFTITWHGSDPGVAAHLEWYEGGTLLADKLRIGPWSETIFVAITSIGPIEDVEMVASGVATSLPEPGTLALLGLGLAPVLRRSRRVPA